jgi:hypothetical protein
VDGPPANGARTMGMGRSWTITSPSSPLCGVAVVPLPVRRPSRQHRHGGRPDEHGSETDVDRTCRAGNAQQRGQQPAGQQPADVDRCDHDGQERHLRHRIGHRPLGQSAAREDGCDGQPGLGVDHCGGSPWPPQPPRPGSPTRATRPGSSSARTGSPRGAGAPSAPSRARTPRGPESANRRHGPDQLRRSRSGSTHTPRSTISWICFSITCSRNSAWVNGARSA